MVKLAKITATGNDFIISLNSKPKNFVQLLDRRLGFGADGLIELSKGSEFYKFSIFNADGSQAEISGNGLRAAAHFLHLEHLVNSSNFLIETSVGRKIVKVINAEADVADIEVELQSPLVIDMAETKVGKNLLQFFLVNVGNPHAVVLTNLKTLSLQKLKALAEKLFQQDLNLEKVVIKDSEVLIEIFERGVGPTLACGSGTVAVAKVLEETGFKAPFYEVYNPGGKLTVRVDEGRYFLRGKSQFVGYLEPTMRYLSDLY